MSLRTTKCLEILGNDSTILREGSGEGRVLIYLWDQSWDTRKGKKLHQEKFRLDIRSRLLTMRALEQRSGHSSKPGRVQAVSDSALSGVL